MKHLPPMFKKAISTQNKSIWGDLEDTFLGLLLAFLGLSAFLLSYMQSGDGKDLRTAFQDAQNKNVSMSKIAHEYRDVRQDLYKSLNQDFSEKWEEWGSNINKSTLSIQFVNPDCAISNSPQVIQGSESKDVFFNQSNYELTPYAKKVLRNFIPQYIDTLTDSDFKDHILEIRVEGHTSSEWRRNATDEQNYLGNLALSQQRARAVVAYIMELKQLRSDDLMSLRENWSWIQRRLTANGLSSSQLIFFPDNTENRKCSRRVVFRVITDGDNQLQQLLQFSK